MSDPTRKHKPYTTGAEPSSTADKANVHMTHSGWVRQPTLTSPWGGCDDADADPEILIAFRGSAVQGWYAYTYWHTTAPSQGTPVLIEVHVHFQEQVNITGNPTITITNDQGGAGGGGTAATLTATYVSNAVKWLGIFRTAVPSANQLKAGDILSIGVNALALSGGTIKDTSDGTTNTIITNAAADTGYEGSANRGGNRSTADAVQTDGPRIIVVA